MRIHDYVTNAKDAFQSYDIASIPQLGSSCEVHEALAKLGLFDKDETHRLFGTTWYR